MGDFIRGQVLLLAGDIKKWVMETIGAVRRQFVCSCTVFQIAGLYPNWRGDRNDWTFNHCRVCGMVVVV